MIQSAILIFSCLSIFLLSSKKWVKWGFVAGIAGQPFWIFETVRHEQYGMFVVSLVFCWCHVRGIRNHF